MRKPAMTLSISVWALTFASIARGLRPETSAAVGGVSVEAGGHFQVRHGKEPEPANETVASPQAGEFEDKLQTEPTAKVRAPKGRADMCDKAKQLREGKVPLAKALDGATLRAVTRPGAHNWIKKDPQTGKWSGFDYEVLKALSEKGNFQFTITEQAMTDEQSANKSQGLDTWLSDTLQEYDINIEYRSMSRDREANHGVNVLFPWLDSSVIMVAQAKESIPFSVSVLLTPYDKYTWIVFAATCLVTCVAYLYVEGALRKEEEVDEDKAGFLGSLYFALMQLATVSSLTPRTYTGKLITVSWSMVAIIFMAGYTANLATCLLEVRNSGLKWHSIADVMAAEARICIHPGASEWYMKNNFPTYDKVVLNDHVHQIENLVKGECEVALTLKNAYQISLGQQDVNPNCQLQQVGPDLTTNLAGWSISQDFGAKCTNVIQAALHLFFEGLWEDDSLDKMYEDVLLKGEQTRAKSCAETAIDDSGDSLSLPLQSMAGLFILHFSVLFSAVACMFLCASKTSEPSTPAATQLQESSQEST